MSYVTFDTETTIKSSFKRKANPFDPDNWVVTYAVKHKGEGVVEHRSSGRPAVGWLRNVLFNSKGEQVKLVVTMNGKFDIQHAIAHDPENKALWMEFVAAGGMLFCIQLAEYLLCGQEQASQMLSLDEIAPRYGGNLKVDEVKLLWQAGVSTEDIEPTLLSRYLCGGLDENGVFQKGDVENTEHVALQQIAIARSRGQLSSLMLNMGALMYTVEAETNGMWVDTVQGMVLADGLREEVAKLTALLYQFIPEDLPFAFNWNSRFHKSALIFGGTVNYDHYEYDLAGTNVDGNGNPAPYKTMLRRDYEQAKELGCAPGLAYGQKDEAHYVMDSGATISVEEFDSWFFNAPPEEDTSTSPWGPRQYYKSGKQAGEYKTKKVKVNDLTKPKGRACKAPYTFKGFTEPDKKWASSEPGFYSTDKDVIEELSWRKDVPFLKAFTGLVKTAKDLGTYFIGEDSKGEKTGMLTMVGLDGLIHHMLNMVSTITARLSSSNPNL